MAAIEKEIAETNRALHQKLDLFQRDARRDIPPEELARKVVLFDRRKSEAWKREVPPAQSLSNIIYNLMGLMPEVNALQVSISVNVMNPKMQGKNRELLKAYLTSVSDRPDDLFGKLTLHLPYFSKASTITKPRRSDEGHVSIRFYDQGVKHPSRVVVNLGENVCHDAFCVELSPDEVTGIFALRVEDSQFSHRIAQSKHGPQSMSAIPYIAHYLIYQEFVPTPLSKVPRGDFRDGISRTLPDLATRSLSLDLKPRSRLQKSGASLDYALSGFAVHARCQTILYEFLRAPVPQELSDAGLPVAAAYVISSHQLRKMTEVLEFHGDNIIRRLSSKPGLKAA